MMVRTIKLNVVIPVEYKNRELLTCLLNNVKVNKDIVKKCVEKDAYDSAEWFCYCFRDKPIEANFQNANSPLILDPKYQIKRIEMNSSVRTMVGLHHNENVVYSLQKENYKFQIGKIRLLFTTSRIAFLHIEIYSDNLNEEDSLRFVNAFSRITSNQPKINYEKKVSKEHTDIIQLSMKEIVLNILQLQSYLPISLFEDRLISYYQICMIGCVDQEQKPLFFESIRSLSKRISSKPIDESCFYKGKEPYISRFVGDRTACIYGDIDICGEANSAFLTDIGNGLAKTATENYLTEYVFLISLQLLTRVNNINDVDIEYLLNAPSRLSDEENIRAFFEKCLWNNGWKLRNTINSIKEYAQRLTEKETAKELERMSEQLKEQNKKLSAASELIKGIDRKIFDDYQNAEDTNSSITCADSLSESDLSGVTMKNFLDIFLFRKPFCYDKEGVTEYVLGKKSTKTFDRYVSNEYSKLMTKRYDPLFNAFEDEISEGGKRVEILVSSLRLPVQCLRMDYPDLKEMIKRTLDSKVEIKRRRGIKKTINENPLEVSKSRKKMFSDRE